MSIIKWLDKNLEYICLAGLLIIMTVLSFTNVILRYVFKAPLSWSDEVCCYCLALSAFITLPCAIRTRVVISVDTLTTLLPEGIKKVLSTICHVLMIAFLFFCVKGSLDLAANAVSVNQTSPALGIPVGYLYYFVAGCFVLAIGRTIQIMYLDWFGKEEKS